MGLFFTVVFAVIFAIIIAPFFLSLISLLFGLAIQGGFWAVTSSIEWFLKILDAVHVPENQEVCVSITKGLYLREKISKK